MTKYLTTLHFGQYYALDTFVADSNQAFGVKLNVSGSNKILSVNTFVIKKCQKIVISMM
jgi:hypothetical protein